jgi:hypothetical protein
MVAKEVEKKKVRESIHKLHEKHYGKRKVVKSAVVDQPKETDRDIALRINPPLKTPVIAQPRESTSREGLVLHEGATRNDLMLAAKERGVKNFRVLNKKELEDVLFNIGDKKKVDEIVAGAVARWKSGWGSKKKEVVA